MVYNVTEKEVEDVCQKNGLTASYVESEVGEKWHVKCAIVSSENEAVPTLYEVHGLTFTCQGSDKAEVKKSTMAAAMRTLRSEMHKKKEEADAQLKMAKKLKLNDAAKAKPAAAAEAEKAKAVVKPLMEVKTDLAPMVTDLAPMVTDLAPTVEAVVEEKAAEGNGVDGMEASNNGVADNIVEEEKTAE